MSEDFKDAPFDRAEIANPDHASAPFELDVAKYRDEIADFDITDKQKDELLETLWAIMRSFVELGFSVDICGHIFGENSLPTHPSSETVDSSHTPTTMEEGTTKGQ